MLRATSSASECFCEVDKVGSTGPKGLAEGLEDAAALISNCCSVVVALLCSSCSGRLPPEGELPEVTSNEAEGSLVADIVDLLHKEVRGTASTRRVVYLPIWP